MAQRHRRLDGLQLHSAKGDVSEQTAMEDGQLLSPTLEGGRPTREREVWYGILGFTVIWIQREKRK